MKDHRTKTPDWINVSSEWLDSKFRIPYTPIRFGLDPIFSLFPVLGDFVTYGVSLLIIFTIGKKGASGEVILRMILNSTVDVILGSIPLIGTIFDVGYKSNIKNLKILDAHYNQDKYQGDGKYLLIITILVISLTIVALIYLAYLVFTKLWAFLQSSI